MYNERREGFSIRDIVIQLLFVVLFVFILVWLFPTKGSVNGRFDEINSKFDVLTNHIFNDNMQAMKDAATSYYTNARLPKSINDVKSMTLREMLELKLLVPFKDANNRSCDLDASYVSITKMEDEYLMKINLSCSDNDAYINVHMGCYNYCEKDICETKSAPVSKPVVNTPTTPTTPVAYLYQYKKVVNGEYTSWGAWSGWSTTSVTSTDLRQVETKTETITETTVVNGSYTAWSGWSGWSTNYVSSNNLRDVETKTVVETEKVQAIVGYKTVTYTDTNKPIWGNVKVQSGTTTEKTCASYKTEYVGTGQYKYEWVSEGKSVYYSVPQNTSTTKYVYVSSTNYSCGNCATGMAEIYEKFVYKQYEVKTEKQVCASYTTKEVPVYVTVPKIIGYETSTKQEPVYGTVNQNKNVTYYRYRTRTLTDGYTIENKKNVKYYRYRTRSLTKGYELYEWSTSSNDKTLINKGYKYTGVSKKK